MLWRNATPLSASVVAKVCLKEWKVKPSSPREALERSGWNSRRYRLEGFMGLPTMLGNTKVREPSHRSPAFSRSSFWRARCALSAASETGVSLRVRRDSSLLGRMERAMLV